MPQLTPEEEHAIAQYLKRKEIMRRNYAENSEARKEYRRKRYLLQKEKNATKVKVDENAIEV